MENLFNRYRNFTTLILVLFAQLILLAYQVKGNTAEAKKTFTDIVDNHPDSPYVAEARKELDTLKG